jgi:hypothetical protein
MADFIDVWQKGFNNNIELLYMCEDCMDESCKCEKCYNYRHHSACPACGHTIFLDCCQGFIDKWAGKPSSLERK